MCGIVGYVGRPDEATLTAMRDALRHRGPDGAGAFIDGPVALGHRRLSIIDRAGGQQPIFNEDRTIAIVFNGEIYNYLDLRARLQQLGHRFATQSDTEVIVHAYEEFGDECPKHLDGMFAFVLYDQQRRQLFGARDRFGKKPLFVLSQPVGAGANRVDFAFASEIKALRQHPVINPSLTLSPIGLTRYLLADYVFGASTFFEQIRQIEHGCAFRFGLPGAERPGFSTWRFWDPSLRTQTPIPTEAEAAHTIERLFDAAIQRRLMSEVPVGVFLSGGIDSSALVARLTRLLPIDQIETFSIGFDDPSFDELPLAMTVAQQFGVKHHAQRFTTNDVFDQLDRVCGMLDEPLADPSILPVSLLSQFARQRVTVALGGDGGDELFAGYDPFRAVRPASILRRLRLGKLSPLGLRLARWLPASAANLPLRFKLERFLRGLSAPIEQQSLTWMGPFAAADLQRLAPDLRRRVDLDQCLAPIVHQQQLLEAEQFSSLQQTLDFFERFYLVDDILVKVDRASMLHSLEVRAPFLDTALAEYVNALPDDFKLTGGQTKYIFKRWLDGSITGQPILPKEIVHRRKKGFGIPVARWIRQELRQEFTERLTSAWPTQLAMFDVTEIERLLNEHLRGSANHYKELWSLYMLSRWASLHW